MIIGIPWLNARLNEKEVKFLFEAIATSIENVQKLESAQGEEPHGWKNDAAGNVSKCNLIDKDNWFYENVLKKHTEKMFYRSYINYYEDYIEKKEPLPEFELNDLWVNFQKKHDHVPLHNHEGLYSFVVFMKIPTHSEEQHVKPKSIISTSSVASDFQFVWKREGEDNVVVNTISLNPEDEGRMLFFPSWLQHQVYPFYDCEEERVTISGNVDICLSDQQTQESVTEYKNKKKMLEMMEKSAEYVREELKQDHLKKLKVYDIQHRQS